MNVRHININPYEVVAVYDIDDKKYVPFKVILKQNKYDDRQFEVVLPSYVDDNFDVLSHSFCQQFILPWVAASKNTRIGRTERSPQLPSMMMQYNQGSNISSIRPC